MQQCKRSELSPAEIMIIQNIKVTKKDSLLFLKEWIQVYQLGEIPLPNFRKKMFLDESLGERLEFQYNNKEYQKKRLTNKR